MKSMILTKKNVTGIVVCWNCHQSDRQLKRIRNEDGKKTLDYICVACDRVGIGNPPIGNVSIIKINKK